MNTKKITRSGANRAGEEELISDRNSIPLAKKQHCDQSAAAQRSRLRAYLIERLTIKTLEARSQLDILMPAARVHELRHRFGHDIQTVRVLQETDAGNLHSVARYVQAVGGAKHGAE